MRILGVGLSNALQRFRFGVGHAAPTLVIVDGSYVLAGFLEEIGWMGFAFPELRSTLRSAIVSAITLGVLWGTWHLPVIDYLGTSTPHGSFLLPYALTFIAAMTGMRVLIAWMYVNTKSVFCAQLMHASSTGFLVVLSPPLVTARQEVLWYGVYALVLWLVVAAVVLRYGVQLKAGRNRSLVKDYLEVICQLNFIGPNKPASLHLPLIGTYLVLCGKIV